MAQALGGVVMYHNLNVNVHVPTYLLPPTSYLLLSGNTFYLTLTIEMASALSLAGSVTCK